MERIASFQVDHKKLNRGIYVSSDHAVHAVKYIMTLGIWVKIMKR